MSKLKTCCCGPQDTRVSLSKVYSIINIIVSTICLVGVTIWIRVVYSGSWGVLDVSEVLMVWVPPYVLGVVFTVLFLWYDSLCCKCCCTCCLGESETVVFDSSNPEAYLVMQSDGQVSNIKYVYINYFSIVSIGCQYEPESG